MAKVGLPARDHRVTPLRPPSPPGSPAGTWPLPDADRPIVHIVVRYDTVTAHGEVMRSLRRLLSSFRPTPLVLQRVPTSRPPGTTRRSPPTTQPKPSPTHRLRMPDMRDPVSRSPPVRNLQSVLPPRRARRPVSKLRRTSRGNRPTNLTPLSAPRSRIPPSGDGSHQDGQNRHHRNGF